MKGPLSNEVVEASNTNEAELEIVNTEQKNDHHKTLSMEENKAYVLTNWNEYKTRGLSLMMRTVESKDELCESIKTLNEYICKLNNFGPSINWVDIEDTIENDFLNMKFH